MTLMFLAFGCPHTTSSSSSCSPFQPHILPSPLTHPVSATSAFFPFRECAKTLSTSAPELVLFFCLEQPFFPQLFTRWLIPFLRGQFTCQLLTRKLAYWAVKSSPFLTPDNYTSPSLPPTIFICFWACCLFLLLDSSTTRIKNCLVLFINVFLKPWPGTQ